MAKTVLERFEEKVIKDPNSGCWLWTGAIQSKGYGMLWLGGDDFMTAHRFSYEHFVGAIPVNLQLDHHCRTRSCVNPNHLEPVTLLENLIRGVKARTHCPHGHEFTLENTYARIDKRGRNTRQCRTCRRDYHKTYKRPVKC